MFNLCWDRWYLSVADTEVGPTELQRLQIYHVCDAVLLSSTVAFSAYKTGKYTIREKNMM